MTFGHENTSLKTTSQGLTDTIRSRIQAHISGQRPESRPFDVRFEEVGGGLKCHVEGKFDFTIGEGLRAAVKYHLMENRSSILEMRAFLERTHDRKILFDVGAHMGLFSLLFCLQGDHKKAVAFEPSPTLSSDARTMIEKNQLQSQISVKNCAVGDDHSPLYFSQERGGLCSSSFNT